MNEVRTIPMTYIGPMIAKYGLIKNKIFKQGIPYDYEPYKRFFNNCKLFKYLFAKPSEMRIKKDNLAKQGTLEYQAALELKKELMANGNV